MTSFGESVLGNSEHQAVELAEGTISVTVGGTVITLRAAELQQYLQEGLFIALQEEAIVEPQEEPQEPTEVFQTPDYSLSSSLLGIPCEPKSAALNSNFIPPPPLKLHLVPSEVSAKFLETNSSPPSSESDPIAVVSLDLLSEGIEIGNPSDLTAKPFSKVECEPLIDLGSLKTYSVDDRGQLGEVTTDAKFNQLILPEDVLVLRHPVLKFNLEQEISRRCLFPVKGTFGPSFVTADISRQGERCTFKIEAAGSQTIESIFPNLNVQMDQRALPSNSRQLSSDVPQFLANPMRLIYQIGPKPEILATGQSQNHGQGNIVAIVTDPNPEPKVYNSKPQQLNGFQQVYIQQQPQPQQIIQQTQVINANIEQPQHQYVLITQPGGQDKYIVRLQNNANLQGSDSSGQKVEYVLVQQHDNQQQQLPIVNNAHLNSSSVVVRQPMFSRIQVPPLNSANNFDLNNLNSPRRSTGVTKKKQTAQQLKNKNQNSQPTMQSPGPTLNQNGQQSSGTPSPSPAAAAVAITPRPPENLLPPPNRQRKCPGMLMLCKYCGQISEDMHYCERCKRRLPDDAKTITDETTPTRSRKQRPVPKPPQPPQEIVLSSDEDEPKSKLLKAESPQKTIISMSYSNVYGGGIVQKTNSDVYDDEINFQELTSAIESVATIDSASDPCVKIMCRSIRVGDYKCVVSGGKMSMFAVYITKLGIMFTIPHAQKRNCLVKCAIPFNAILLIESHNTRKLSVLFIATGPRYAKNIRKLLGLSDDPKSEGAFFCPSNGDQYQKRITIVPDEPYNSEAQGIIHKIFGRTVSDFDFETANKTLVKLSRPAISPSKASTSTATAIQVSVLARNPNSLSSASAKESNSNSIASEGAEETGTSRLDILENALLLTFKGSVNIQISQQDILCLADEVFLNDSIIDFWLRYVEKTMLSPEDQERTYIFSTFFYKTLTTRQKRKHGTPPVETPKALAPETRHNRVKRWTKNVDIFSKDFLILPICENLHWFLAVICFPGLLGVHDLETGEPIPDYVPPPKKGTPKPNGDSRSSEGMNIEPQQGTSQPKENDEKSKRRRIKQPCILILDSLIGDSRTKIYSTLRDYLKVEFKTRKGEDREFTKAGMPGGMLKVPQQNNNCDCGLYALHYVEKFFNTPIPSYEFPFPPRLIWPTGECDGKREQVYTVIKELIKESNPENLALVPLLTFGEVKTEPVDPEDDTDHDYALPPEPEPQPPVTPCLLPEQGNS